MVTLKVKRTGNIHKPLDSHVVLRLTPTAVSLLSSEIQASTPDFFYNPLPILLS